MSYEPNTPSQPSYPPPSNDGQQGYGNAPAYGSPGGYPTQGGYPPAAQDSNGIGLAGFIVAIVSILTCVFGVLGMIVSVVGIVLSAVGLSKANKGAQRRGLSLAGIIIGGITLVLDVILTVVAVSILT